MKQRRTHNSRHRQLGRIAPHQAAVQEVGTTVLSPCWCMVAPCRQTDRVALGRGRLASAHHYSHTLNATDSRSESTKIHHHTAKINIKSYKKAVL